MQTLEHHVGYSRGNECWFVRFYPYQTEQQAKDAVSAFTRPAAPVEGLVRYDEDFDGGEGIQPFLDGEYVRFDQAEAIIAAERTMLKTAEQRLAQSQDDLKQARSNNAALTARVKELEELPCDVQLPGVILKRGVKFSVLLAALKRRESWPENYHTLSSQPVADGWLTEAKRLYDQCKLWPENSPEGFTALLQLRNHVASILPASPGASE